MLSGKVFIKTCTLSKHTPLPQQITINDSFQQYLFVLLLSLLHIMTTPAGKTNNQNKLLGNMTEKPMRHHFLQNELEPGSVRQQSNNVVNGLVLMYFIIYSTIPEHTRTAFSINCIYLFVKCSQNIYIQSLFL